MRVRRTAKKPEKENSSKQNKKEGGEGFPSVKKTRIEIDGDPLEERRGSEEGRGPQAKRVKYQRV